MKMWLAVSSVFLLFLVGRTVAATRHVVPPGTPGAAPAGGYTSWGTAATNIADAVAAAGSGDLVLVSNGIYRLSATIEVATDIALRSFADGAAEPAGTILDGGYPERTIRCLSVNHAGAVVDGFTVTNAFLDTGYGAGIYLQKGMVSNCVVTGCTTTNGGGGGVYLNTGGVLAHSLVTGNTALSPTANLAVAGGGVYVANGGIVSNCVVINNRARDGGGINMASASITAVNSGLVIGCVVSNNLARPAEGQTLNGGSGGGIRMYYKGMIRECLVVGNQARPSAGGSGSSGYAAGMIVGEGGIARDCVITNNTGSTYGGGLSVGRGCVASNCWVSGNSASYGGGAYLNSNGMLLDSVVISNNVAFFLQGGTIRNCLVAGNNAGTWIYSGGMLQSCTIVGNGYGVTVGTGSGSAITGIVENCILYGNGSSGVNYSSYGNGANNALVFTNTCTLPQPAGAYDSGVITAAPRLVDEAGGDFRLRGGSPCVNAGVWRAWMEGARDLDGRQRVIGAAVDLGVYEYMPSGTILHVR